MKKVLFSLMAMLLFAVSGIAQTTYTMVNSASQLEAGAQYVLVGYDNDGQAFIMSYQKSNNRHAIAISEAGGEITATVATDPSQQDAPYEFTLDGAAGAWTIYDPLNNGYLCAPGGGNYLRTQTTLDDFGRWTITDGDEGGMVPVSNGGAEQCYMRYNITSTLFGCYKESSNVAAPVYFFKAGGATSPKPEPTNYPTNFSYSMGCACVTLNWTDSEGGQLPDAYLILGSTSTIVAPQDHTPVLDGYLIANVVYGVQTVTFCGLEGNTTYRFAIFPYTNSGSAIDYKNDNGYPEITVATGDIVYLLNDDFEGEDFEFFTPYDMYGDQSWRIATYNENSYAYVNGYASGGAHENEDWLISDIMSGGYQTIIMQFRTAMNYTGDDLSLMISTDYDGVSEPTDFEWTDLTDMFDWSTGNYTWVESGIVDITDYTGEHFCIAFVYKSSDEAAAAWEVDDVMVIGCQALSVSEQSDTQLVISPNPASEQVSFTLESDAQVSIFDMTGRMVSTMAFEAGQAQVSVSELVNGVYFVNVRYADGTTAVSKFVKF